MIAASGKCCASCGLVKPLDHFAAHSRSADGRWRYCRLCERRRIKSWVARRAGVLPVEADTPVIVLAKE